MKNYFGPSILVLKMLERVVFFTCLKKLFKTNIVTSDLLHIVSIFIIFFLSFSPPPHEKFPANTIHDRATLLKERAL